MLAGIEAKKKTDDLEAYDPVKVRNKMIEDAREKNRKGKYVKIVKGPSKVSNKAAKNIEEHLDFKDQTFKMSAQPRLSSTRNTGGAMISSKSEKGLKTGESGRPDAKERAP